MITNFNRKEKNVRRHTHSASLPLLLLKLITSESVIQDWFCVVSLCSLMRVNDLVSLVVKELRVMHFLFPPTLFLHPHPTRTKGSSISCRRETQILLPVESVSSVFKDFRHQLWRHTHIHMKRNSVWVLVVFLSLSCLPNLLYLHLFLLPSILFFFPTFTLLLSRCKRYF